MTERHATLGFMNMISNRSNAAALALATVFLAPAMATAAGAKPPGALAATPDSPERRLAQDLAKSITAKLPPPAKPAGPCDQKAVSAMRGAVESVIADAKPMPSREIAVAAIQLARDQSPATDTCRLAALDDSSTELSGDGEMVADNDVRGFTLVSGVIPPKGQVPAVTKVAMAEPAGPAPPPVAAKAASKPAAMGHAHRHRHHRRHHHHRHAAAAKSQ